MRAISANKPYVIFDFDGTIVDTNNIHSKAFNNVFDIVGLCGFNYDYYKGWKTIDVFRDFFQSHNMYFSNKELDKFVNHKQTQARDLMSDNLKEIPRAIEYIKYLFEIDKKLVLATSASRESVMLALNKLKIMDKFKFIITGDDVKKAKPSPEIYHKALEIAYIEASQAVVIEDSESGAIAASKANIEVIIVNNKSLINQYYCSSFSRLLQDIKIEVKKR